MDADFLGGYTLFSSTNLAANSWQPVTTNADVGRVVSVTNTVSGRQEFFRFRQGP